MQSNNGDLYFRAGIDLDGFNAGASAMERRMKEATSNVVNDAGRMDDALSKIGNIFTRLVGAGTAAGFVKEMFNVRSEMQNTEAMLRVFLGSAEKADSFFKSLQGYAYNNVFEFKDLAKQSAQLLAYRTNVEDVIPTLNKLSEIAAGTNTPLAELVSVFNKVKATDRLDSDAIYSLGNKGIDVRQAIAEIRELETGQKMLSNEVDVTGLKFKDLQKIIDHVSTNGGMFEGMMQEKMKTLGDSWGLMQDNLTNMFNEIGEASQGLLKSGMDVGNFLIENYQSVGRVLATLVVAYGSAKAASIAMSIAQKNGTGITVLDNTAWSIRAALLKGNIEGGKDVTSTIRQIKAAQEEEIVTLKAAVTEQEHEEIIRKSRVVNLNDILTASQKARLAQMGLNEASEDYLPIAISMLDKEQSMKMSKAELTNNNQSYIDALREVIGARGDEIKSIDDRIAVATEELRIAEELANSAADEKESLLEKVSIMKDYYEQSLNNVDATDLQEKAEALETAQSELEAASKAAEATSETRNTAQKKLNELQTKKNAVAEATDTAATKANAAAKGVLTVAVGRLKNGVRALWAVMKANPVGAVLTVATTLLTVIQKIVDKSKDAKEAQDEENKALAEFHKEVNSASDRLSTLEIALSTATKGSAAYNQALKQVNDMCKEYNVELINTNDSLQTQKNKYDALRVAIESVTAAKLREQFTSTAMQNMSDRNEGIMSNFRKRLTGRRVSKELGGDVFSDETKFSTMWGVMLSKAQEAANGNKSDWAKAYSDVLSAMNHFSSTPIKKGGEAAKALSDTFTLLVMSAKGAQEEIKKADDALEIYDKAVSSNNGNVKEETTSLSDLNKQLIEQDAIITRLQTKAKNVGITKLEEADLEDAQKRKSEIEKRIKALGGKTTSGSNNGADDMKKAVEQMTATELKLENERQAAIIATMQDGAEKQQTQIRFEYQQRLQAIKVAEEEYSRQRKAAGKSSEIDQESEAGKSFAAQRLAAETDYQRKSYEIFTNEIEDKKQQYELYNKWVTAVGQETADKQFSDLIEKGKTFEDWVSGEISRLEEKKKVSTLSSGENTFLSELQNEIGKSSQSYKSYFDELQKSIDKAPSLAAKLQLLNNAIAELKGDGKNSNAKNDTLLKLAQMVTEVNEMMIEVSDDAERAFAEKYKSYSKIRRDAIEQYQKDIENLIKANDGNENAFQVVQAKKEMMHTIEGLDTDFFKSLFSDVFAGNATKKAIKKALSDLKGLKEMDLVTFNSTYNTDFTQEELGQLKERIDDVNSALKQMGTYNIGDAFRDIRDGHIEGDLEKVARGIQHIQDIFSGFTSVVSQLSSALNGLADVSDNENLKDTTGTVSSVSSVLSSAGSWAGMGASIGGGWGALIGAVLGGGIGIVTEILNKDSERNERIAQSAEAGTEFQHNVAENLTSILSSVENLTDTVTSLNYEQFRSSLISLIEELKESNRQITEKDENGKSYWNKIFDSVFGSSLSDVNKNSQVFGSTDVRNIGNTAGIWQKLVANGLISEEEAMERERQIRQSSQTEDWNSSVNNFLFGWLDDLSGTERTHTYHIDEDEYKRLTSESVANYINWVVGQFSERQSELINELQDMYNLNSYDSLSYFNKENEVYQSQLEWLKFQRNILASIGEDTKDLDRQIAEMEHGMTESLQHMAEGLYGIDISGIIDEWISIFDEFGSNVEGAFDKIDQGIDQMIANMLRKRLVVEPLMEQLTAIFDEYKNDVGSEHVYTNEDFINIANRIRDAKGEAYEGYQEYLQFLENLGINLDDIADTSTLTGSIQNLTEETGGIIAGRLNAMVINQAEGNNFLRQSLLVQYDMRNYLGQIQVDVASIKANVGVVGVRFNENMNYGYAEQTSY